MTIDVESLRDELKNECMGACFGGGFGAALIDLADVASASPEELVNIALRLGVDLSKHRVD